MESYKTFNQKNWNDHSVLLPKEMAKTHPSEVTVLDYTRFFWPLWDENGLRRMFLEKSWDFSNNFAVHLWETASKQSFLQNLTIDVIRTADSGIYCEMRRILFGTNGSEHGQDCRFRVGTSQPDGLVGYWNFDHPQNNKIPDLSGNGLHGWSMGAILPSYETSVGVRYGKVLSLQARGAHPFLPIMPGISAGDSSVSVWISLSDLEQNQKDVLRIVTATHAISVTTNAVTGIPVKDSSTKESKRLSFFGSGDSEAFIELQVSLLGDPYVRDVRSIKDWGLQHPRCACAWLEPNSL